MNFNKTNDIITYYDNVFMEQNRTANNWILIKDIN